jgi:hypothetical protein
MRKHVANVEEHIVARAVVAFYEKETTLGFCENNLALAMLQQHIARYG